MAAARHDVSMDLDISLWPHASSFAAVADKVLWSEHLLNQNDSNDDRCCCRCQSSEVLIQPLFPIKMTMTIFASCCRW